MHMKSTRQKVRWLWALYEKGHIVTMLEGLGMCVNAQYSQVILTWLGRMQQNKQCKFRRHGLKSKCLPWQFKCTRKYSIEKSVRVFLRSKVALQRKSSQSCFSSFMIITSGVLLRSFPWLYIFSSGDSSFFTPPSNMYTHTHTRTHSQIHQELDIYH